MVLFCANVFTSFQVLNFAYSRSGLEILYSNYRFPFSDAIRSPLISKMETHFSYGAWNCVSMRSILFFHLKFGITLAIFYVFIHIFWHFRSCYICFGRHQSCHLLALTWKTNYSSLPFTRVSRVLTFSFHALLLSNHPHPAQPSQQPNLGPSKHCHASPSQLGEGET